MYQSLKPKLSPEQKQTLDRLLQLRLTLRHESFEQALTGIEGMKMADSILKSKNLKGLLIGGLAETVHNKRHTKKDFSAHKDVDVLVLDLEDSGIERLEGGIDWWLPQSEQLRIHYLSGDTVKNVTFWENAFGVQLSFGVERYDDMGNPGLYIPSSDLVVRMRVAEAFSTIDSRTAISEDIEESLRAKLEQRIKSETAPSIEKLFGEPVSAASIDIYGFDSETVSAIRRTSSMQE